MKCYGPSSSLTLFSPAAPSSTLSHHTTPLRFSLSEPMAPITAISMLSLRRCLRLVRHPTLGEQHIHPRFGHWSFHTSHIDDVRNLMHRHGFPFGTVVTVTLNTATTSPALVMMDQRHRVWFDVGPVSNPAEVSFEVVARRHRCAKSRGLYIPAGAVYSYTRLETPGMVYTNGNDTDKPRLLKTADSPNCHWHRIE